jgi:hypothetical protein
MVFRDAFGERRRLVPPGTSAGTDALDVLCLRKELTAVPSFEFALRERVSRLATFRHPCFAHVRTVERLSDPARTLALISNATPGIRLSELLATAAKHSVVIDNDAALCLIRQLATAMATFHEQAPDAAHGTLGPERIVITPAARLVIVEHVMGAAVEQLQFSEDRYWRELRVPCPRSPALPVFDQRADVLQIGIVALTLLLRRVLNGDEFPSRVGDAVVSSRAISADGTLEALPSGLRPWLMSALQLDGRSSFKSAIEASHDLEKVFERNNGLGDPAALAAFLERYHNQPDAARMPAVTRAVEAPAATPMAPPPEAIAAPVPAAVPPFSTPAIVLEPIAQATAEPPAPRHYPVEPVRTARFESAPERAPTHVLFEHAEPAVNSSTEHRGGARRAAVAAVLLLALAGGGTLAARRFFTPSAALTGTVAITTNPPGAQVLLDGQAQGVSPTELTVSPGTHVIELRGAGEPRSISIDVAAGAQLSQYIELGKSQASASGSLQVRTEPPGATISVDGTVRGPSPVTISELAAGEHIVIVETEAGTTTQTVMVEAGAMASLVAQLPVQAGPASGWISVITPRPVQLFEDGRLLGSSDSERLMVSAGSHRLDIVHDALGYRETRTIQVSAGKVSAINVEFPMGTIALNATPWADVWIDGEKVGETPIGNLPVTLGSHEVILRHPDFGEQRHVVTVTLSAPARLSVDMRKQP